MAVNQPGFYNPPRGTHHGDGFRQGLQYDASYGQGLPGAPNQPIFVQDYVPLTAQTNNVVTAITPVAAGDLSIAAGTGTTAGTYGANGIPAVIFDVERCLSVTGTNGNAAVTLTAWGFDNQNAPMTAQVQTPTTATTVNSTKAFKGITRINVSGGTTGNITVGTSDIFGLDYRIYSKNYVIPYWDGYLETIPHTNLKGTSTLGSGSFAAGTATILTSAVQANSVILVTRKTAGGTEGFLTVPIASIVPGISFTVQSMTAGAAIQTLDTSTFEWEIVSVGTDVISGTATLNGASPASVVVTNTNVIAASSVILLTYNTGATALGNLRAATADLVDGTSFTISSDANGDVSTVNWYILNTSNDVGTSGAMTAGAVTVANSNITANSTIMLTRNTFGTAAGKLTIGVVTPGTGFTILSSAGTETSTINYQIVNTQPGGVLLIGDGTTATANTGDTRGTYATSSPSNGDGTGAGRRLTLYIYNRGVSAVANYLGNLNNDPTLTNTIVNLYGVPQYYVTPF